MKQVFVVIDLAETSTFDLTDDRELDDLAEDLLTLVNGVASATVYASLEEMMADQETAH